MVGVVEARCGSAVILGADHSELVKNDALRQDDHAAAQSGPAAKFNKNLTAKQHERARRQHVVGQPFGCSLQKQHVI